MITAKEQTLNYENMPNFEDIYNNVIGSVEGMATLMRTVEDIRYMMFAISYIMNDCTEIYEVDSILDKTYAKHLPESDMTNTRFVEFINILHALAYHKCRDAIQKNINKLKPIFETSDVEEIYNKLITERDWDKISNKFYNELENPAIVDKILDYIFDTKNSTKTTHAITMYDFHGRQIEFLGEKEMELFCEIIDTGTAYERDTDGSWIESYDIG